MYLFLQFLVVLCASVSAIKADFVCSEAFQLSEACRYGYTFVLCTGYACVHNWDQDGNNKSEFKTVQI